MSLARSPVMIRISSVAVNVAVVDAAATSGALKAEPRAPLLAARHRLFFQATAQAKAPLRSRQTAQKAAAPQHHTPRLKAEKVAQGVRMDLAKTVVVADVVVAAALALKAAVTPEAADSPPPAELQATSSKSAEHQERRNFARSSRRS